MIKVHSSIEARLDVVDGLNDLKRSRSGHTDKSGTELVNAEDRFTYVRDALKTLNKMDFDKLIVAVRFCHSMVHRIISEHPDSWPRQRQGRQAA